MEKVATEKVTTGFGVDVSNCKTYDEILEKSGTNWTVTKVPLFTFDGTPVDDAYAIKRDTDGKILCPNVSERYVPFQQEDFREILEGVMRLGAKPLRADSYYGGRRVWFQFGLEDRDISGDTYRRYIYGINSHDKTSSVTFAVSMQRIACSNAINMMMKNATSRWTISHTGDIKEKLAEARRTILLADKYADAYAIEAERLRGEAIDRNYIENFTEMLFPMPREDEDKEVRESQKLIVLDNRARFLDIYDNKDDLSLLGNNKFKLLQTASDFVSHPVFRRNGARTEERYADRMMMGHPVLNKAYKYLAA